MCAHRYRARAVRLATGCRIGEVLAVHDRATDWQAETVAIAANIVRVERV